MTSLLKIRTDFKILVKVVWCIPASKQINALTLDKKCFCFNGH